MTMVNNIIARPILGIAILSRKMNIQWDQV